jgi:hypothetical protein
VAARYSAYDRQQEGNQRSPAAQNARRYISERLVHGAPD